MGICCGTLHAAHEGVRFISNECACLPLPTFEQSVKILRKAASTLERDLIDE